MYVLAHSNPNEFLCDCFAHPLGCDDSWEVLKVCLRKALRTIGRGSCVSSVFYFISTKSIFRYIYIDSKVVKSL